MEMFDLVVFFHCSLSKPYGTRVEKHVYAGTCILVMVGVRIDS
jgi:hypothetical protein